MKKSHILLTRIPQFEIVLRKGEYVVIERELQKLKTVI